MVFLQIHQVDAPRINILEKDAKPIGGSVGEVDSTLVSLAKTTEE